MLNNKVQELIQQGLPVKLHLGCCNRYFDGYVNIDGEYMKDDPNVIIHDITTVFPIPDNSVDEILTVHVIEHIDRWAIEDTLTEWHRILRPGGQLSTEWPDLLKACLQIAKDPSSLLETQSRENKRVTKHTMHVIYGNPRFKHKAMTHAWGYSIDSLTELMKKIGFSSVTAEENLYRKTPNDSRVVAIK